MSIVTQDLKGRTDCLIYPQISKVQRVRGSKTSSEYELVHVFVLKIERGCSDEEGIRRDKIIIFFLDEMCQDIRFFWTFRFRIVKKEVLRRS